MLKVPDLREFSCPQKFCKMQFRGPARSGQVLGEFWHFARDLRRFFWKSCQVGSFGGWWFGGGSGVVRGVVRWFGGVVRGWFGGGSGMVRGWFGGGSGVVRVWFKSRFSRKCVNFSHFDDFGEFPSVYARSGNLQFFFSPFIQNSDIFRCLEGMVPTGSHITISWQFICASVSKF